MELTMKHAVSITPDGRYHVTNFVGGYVGQHHVHSAEGFERWKANPPAIREENITIGNVTACCREAAKD